jgi:CIC family chloride channel protein
VTDIVRSGSKSFADSARRRHLRFWALDTTVLRRRLRISDAVLFLSLALLSAGGAALAVIGFRASIDWIDAALHGPASASHGAWLILIPGVAGLAIALLIAGIFPAMKGSGVNETKAAVYVNGGRTPIRSAVGKFITSSLAIGAGFSLGPEDPSLHIGAAIASLVGRSARLTRDRLRLMVPIGAAAGLAAAFNAPISAVLFVVEEITGGWTARTLGASILAASASVVMARSLLGAGPLFHVAANTATSPAVLLGAVSIGVIGGLVSVVFARGLCRLRGYLKALPRWTNYLLPATAGLLIGLIAYLGAPQIMGAGYATVDRAIAGQFVWQMLLVLAALKILATTLSVASGTPGGLFAPALFIGAMLGGGVGGAERALWPALQTATSTDALVGMSAVFAGFLRAPMTAIFMAVEVSGNYSIIIPATIASVLAYLISHRLQPIAIFDLLGRQDGWRLPSMEQERETRILRVEDAMRPPPPVLAADDPVADGVALLAEVGAAHLLIRHPTAGWRIVSGAALRAIAERDAGTVPLAAACLKDGPPAIYPDHPLNAVLHHLHAWPLLPVLHRAHGERLEGVLTLDAALRICNAKESLS